jgi:hypothetical protein
VGEVGVAQRGATALLGIVQVAEGERRATHDAAVAGGREAEDLVGAPRGEVPGGAAGQGEQGGAYGEADVARVGLEPGAVATHDVLGVEVAARDDALGQAERHVGSVDGLAGRDVGVAAADHVGQHAPALADLVAGEELGRSPQRLADGEAEQGAAEASAQDGGAVGGRGGTGLVDGRHQASSSPTRRSKKIAWKGTSSTWTRSSLACSRPPIVAASSATNGQKP